MIAPVTVEIALSTIPAKPIIIPLFGCDENQNNNPVVAVSSTKFYDDAVSSENEISSTHELSVARIRDQRGRQSRSFAPQWIYRATSISSLFSVHTQLCEVSKTRS
jgi:hypothetical protein